MRTRIVSRVAIVVLAFSYMTSAENLEKAQKRELQIQAKAMITEAKSLEKSGQLAEARAKFANSQSMFETSDAADAIKHLDEQIRERARDSLTRSHKLYESHQYMDAAAALEEGSKLGASESIFSYDLALCDYQLGDRNSAIENMNRAIRATAAPKEKLKLKQLLTYLQTGEIRTNSSAKSEIDRVNQLLERLGLDASLDDGHAMEDDEQNPTPDVPALTPIALIRPTPSSMHSHTVVTHRKSVCAALEALAEKLASSPAELFNRANCAESNGRPKEAVGLLRQYLDLSPNALDASDVRQRIAELEAQLSVPEPSGAQIRRLYASAYDNLAEGKYEEALAAFLKAQDASPDFAFTYWNLGLFYEATANIERAKDNYERYQQLIANSAEKEKAALHIATLEAKKSKYDDEVDAAEEVLSDLFNRGMNLTFNFDDNRSAIHAKRARIKKKKDRRKDRNRVGGFSVPYAYAQQHLALATDHLNVALALFPLGAEANELMGLIFLQANDGSSATRSFDVVASQDLPVSFYAEMRGGHKFDHAVKCELVRDRVRFVFLSSYDKKGMPIPPDRNAGDDGLGDITLAPGDPRQPFDSLELGISQIKTVETNKGVLTIKLAGEQFTLAPIYLPTFTPVEGPPARRFANNYTRLFIRYPGLEDSKLGVEGMTGTEKFVIAYRLTSAGFNIAINLNPIGAITATQNAIGIARIIHAAVSSLSVSFASWEQSAGDQQQLLASRSFKQIPSEPMDMAFAQDAR